MTAGEILAGALLVASTLLPAGWGVGLRFTGRRLSNAPFETWPRHARAMRWTVSAWLVALLLGTGGFAVVSRLLASAQAEALAAVGLVLLVLSAALAILEGTHHMTLGIWSAEEAVRTGTEPAFAAPLRRWTSAGLQTAYYVLWLVGLSCYGGALLLSQLLPAWVGATALAWGVLLLGALVLRRGLWTWGLVVPVPAVVGAALILGM